MGVFSDRVFEMVEQIPRGKVATYGLIAKLIGSPKSARYVGFALRGNPLPVEIPCHRVLFADGRLTDAYVFGGPDVQRDLLLAEGVAFIDHNHVDLAAHLWEPPDDLYYDDSPLGR